MKFCDKAFATAADLQHYSNLERMSQHDLRSARTSKCIHFGLSPYSLLGVPGPHSCCKKAHVCPSVLSQHIDSTGFTFIKTIFVEIYGDIERRVHDWLHILSIFRSTFLTTRLLGGSSLRGLKASVRFASFAAAPITSLAVAMGEA